MKRITKDMITYDLSICRDPAPVVGNVSNFGDSRWDKHIEDGIVKRLEDGDYWAWGLVTVRASYGALRATKSINGVHCNGGRPEFEDMILPHIISDLVADLNHQAMMMFNMLAEDGDNIQAPTLTRDEMIDKLVATVLGWDAAKMSGYVQDHLRCLYEDMDISDLQSAYSDFLDGNGPK